METPSSLFTLFKLLKDTVHIPVAHATWMSSSSFESHVSLSPPHPIVWQVYHKFSSHAAIASEIKEIIFKVAHDKTAVKSSFNKGITLGTSVQHPNFCSLYFECQIKE